MRGKGGRKTSDETTVQGGPVERDPVQDWLAIRQSSVSAPTEYWVNTRALCMEGAHMDPTVVNLVISAIDTAFNGILVLVTFIATKNR